jgi:polyhydroxyalkanoic acid synthase PhaR subunit
VSLMNNTFDPIQLWKSWYDVVEKTWGKSLDDWVKTEEYAAWTGQLQKWFFYSQDHYKKAIDQILNENHLPNKDELARVAQLVIQLEEKVEKMDERIDDEVLVELQSIRHAVDRIAAVSVNK